MSGALKNSGGLPDRRNRLPHPVDTMLVVTMLVVTMLIVTMLLVTILALEQGGAGGFACPAARRTFFTLGLFGATSQAGCRCLYACGHQSAEIFVVAELARGLHGLLVALSRRGPVA